MVCRSRALAWVRWNPESAGRAHPDLRRGGRHRRLDRASHRNRSRPLRTVRQSRDQHLQRRARGSRIRAIAFRVFGLGTLPVRVALVALAIPPMVTNSYVGLREVDPDVKEAARGMGYRELAQLVRVELPLAVPLVMAGIRTSAVQVVATATLAALIAGGGFGRYVIDGFAQQDYTKLFAGAVLVAALAMATELSLSGVEWLLVPRGLRLLQASAATRAATFKTA